MRLTRLSIAVLAVIGFAAVPALAQTPSTPRLPIFAADVRGVFARLGQDETTAKGLSTTALELPAGGLGLVGGAHVYVWRGETMALGVGAEAILARASRALIDSTTGKESGTVINRRLRAATAQLSVNFGRREGWSYLTAGMGPTSFESYLAGATPDGLRPASLNFGGGARWFNWEHLGFSADIRFYATKPALATANTAQHLRKNLLVFSGGISLK